MILLAFALFNARTEKLGGINALLLAAIVAARRPHRLRAHDPHSPPRLLTKNKTPHRSATSCPTKTLSS